MIAEIRELEHKARRPDVLVDEQALFEFYDALVPAGMHNTAAFEAWRKQTEATQPKLLYMTREYLMRHAGQVVTRTMLLEAVWDYHFDPQTNVVDVLVSRLRDRVDRPFDRIVFSYALSMFPDWRSALGQALTALRPGGTFVALQYHPTYLAPIMRQHFAVLRRELYLWNIPPTLLLTAPLS